VASSADRKYITYRNAVRGAPSHDQRVTCTKIGEDWILRSYMLTNTHITCVGVFPDTLRGTGGGVDVSCAAAITGQSTSVTVK